MVLSIVIQLLLVHSRIYEWQHNMVLQQSESVGRVINQRNNNSVKKRK